MAKVLLRTMRLSAIARLMGPRRTAVVVLLGLTVALAMVAMALTTSAGAMPPDPNLVRDFEEGGGSRPPPPYKPPTNGFKWSMHLGLGGDFGLGIFATGYPTSKKISCDTQAVTDPIEETVAVTNSGLKYDPTAGQYNYNLKTEKA